MRPPTDFGNRPAPFMLHFRYCVMPIFPSDTSDLLGLFALACLILAACIFYMLRTARTSGRGDEDDFGDGFGPPPTGLGLVC